VDRDGPKWQGAPPAGIAGVVRCETELAYALYRTQLFGPEDLDNVKRTQGDYRVQPLSDFLGKPAPEPAAAITFANGELAQKQDAQGSIKAREGLGEAGGKILLGILKG
jgi:hypothetical protein